ncbi:MAG: hypothetical protein Q4D29_04640 [Lachnospiraceae bacterium]|nr:hypothetical protein [Lachnospiraceae bacterium]
MEAISELRERILEIYSRLEMYINPVGHFILALVSIIMINSGLGFMDKLSNPIIVIVVAIIAAFLPLNFTIVIDALFILLHMYDLSIQVAAVVGMVFLIMFVLYFRFTPKEAIAVVITPIFFALKIPYVVPLALGFIGSPLSFISVCCGTVVYFIIKGIDNMSSQLNAEFSVEGALSGIKSVIDNVLNNKTMILLVIVCALIVVLANVIKRLSFDFSWQVALAVSGISGLIVIIIGSSVLDAEISIVGAIVSMIISMILVFVMQLFVHNVDYSRAEYVQFEDEDYIYYVKAIPRFGVDVRRGSR